MFKLTIDGPDAEDKVHEEIDFRGLITACNVYVRLAGRNLVTLEFPGGKKINSKDQPDPWEAYPQA